MVNLFLGPRAPSPANGGKALEQRGNCLIVLLQLNSPHTAGEGARGPGKTLSYSTRGAFGSWVA